MVSLFLSCRALSSPTICRFIPAHCLAPWREPLFEGQTKAVVELATLQSFNAGSLAFLDLLTQGIGAVFNTIEATMRTEGLLTQSQQLTVELQSRQSHGKKDG